MNYLIANHVVGRSGVLRKSGKRAIGNRKWLALLAPLIFAFSANSIYGQPLTAQESLEQRNAELEQKAQQRETKMDRLAAKEQENEGANAAAVQSVIKDADQHSQLFTYQDSLTSGYDPAVGYVLRSDDGGFSLHPGVVLDFRNMTSYRERVPAGGGGSEVTKSGYDTQNGFDLTRARLIFDGSFTKQITYFIQFQADQGASLSLLDAYWVYHFGEGVPFSIKVGQFKDPIWHERNVSEATLLAVDRSLVESLLGGGQTSRVQGLDLVYDKDRLRAQAVIHDGYDSLNTKFYDGGGIGAGVGGGAGITPTDFGASGRVEYLAIGKRTSDLHPFSEYDRQFTALGDKQDFVVIGGGADFSQGGANDVIFHTADVQYDSPTGLSLYSAYLASYREIKTNEGVAKGSYYDPGFLAQAAYLLTPKFEPFIRYDYTHLAPKSVTGLRSDLAQEITIGGNYYFFKHNAKFTVDASLLPNGAPADSDALGILKDTGRNEIVVRAQFQLAL